MRIQIDDIVRDATPEEEARILAAQADSLTVEEARQAAIAAKESAKAKLAALGLTEAEVNAIIGGV